MINIDQIGKNIRLYREKLGITQRMLSDSIMVSFQAISAWERGMSVPDLENAARYLRTHPSAVTLNTCRGESARLPVLMMYRGRIELVRGKN